MFQILHIIEHIYNCDKRFQILKIKSDISSSYLKQQRYATAGTLFASTSVLIVFVFDVLCYADKFNVTVVGNNIAYCVPLITTNCMLLQFCTYAMVLKQRFKWLNLKLKTAKQFCVGLKYGEPAQFAQTGRILEVQKEM